MSTTTIYAHPDGHEITVGYGLLTACTSDGFALSMPIGPDGLAALGAALIERSIAQKHGEVSERAGAAPASRPAGNHQRRPAAPRPHGPRKGGPP